MAETYDTNRSGGASGMVTAGSDTGGVTPVGYNTPRIDVDTSVVTPTDRVRWGPIIAGLFTAHETPPPSRPIERPAVIWSLAVQPTDRPAGSLQ